MWELWTRSKHGWHWNVIGAQTRADLSYELGLAMDDEAVLDIRVLSDEAQRPGVVA